MTTLRWGKIRSMTCLAAYDCQASIAHANVGEIWDIELEEADKLVVVLNDLKNESGDFVIEAEFEDTIQNRIRTYTKTQRFRKKNTYCQVAKRSGAGCSPFIPKGRD